MICSENKMEVGRHNIIKHGCICDVMNPHNSPNKTDLIEQKGNKAASKLSNSDQTIHLPIQLLTKTLIKY